MVTLSEKYIKEIDFDIINKNIDLNLKLIAKYPRNSFLANQFFEFEDEEKLPSNPKTAIKELMIIESLIDIKSEHFCNLTKFGYDVYRNAGWLKYLERERFKKIREDKKNTYDFRLSKWKHFTFFITLIIAVVALSISIFNLLESKNLRDNEQELSRLGKVKT